MRKMPCLFVREFHGKNSFSITDKVSPGCDWVIRGEGNATIKWDGTACLVKDKTIWKRYDAKKNPRTGIWKDPPPGSIPCDPTPDPVTGHWPHWVMVDPAKPEDRWHAEAWRDWFVGADDGRPVDGTYELIGPAINGNPHRCGSHLLIAHLALCVTVPDRTFDAIREFLCEWPYEGIVFHHPDGRMCKIRRNDFGLSWPIERLTPEEDRKHLDSIAIASLATRRPSLA